MLAQPFNDLYLMCGTKLEELLAMGHGDVVANSPFTHGRLDGGKTLF